MQDGRQRRVRCVPHPAAPRPCRIPRRLVRTASRGAGLVSHPRRRVRVASRGAAWRRVRVASRHRVRVASRGAACVSYPAAPCPCPAAPRMRSRRRRAGAMSDACASEAAGRRLHTEGSDQNACMHVAAARGARRRATGGASLGEGDGSADPRVSDTGARAMAGARNHWSATPAVGPRGARVRATAGARSCRSATPAVVPRAVRRRRGARATAGTRCSTPARVIPPPQLGVYDARAHTVA